MTNLPVGRQVKIQRFLMCPASKEVIFYVTDNGFELAQRLKGLFPQASVIRFKSEEFAREWRSTKKIVCIMATGIVVRAAAPLIKDKRIDPAVVVLDEKGKFAISLLSGHLGGANALAKEIADYLGAEAVITTASDVQGKLALDVWAIGKNLHIENFEKLKKLSARIVNGERIRLKTDETLSARELPDEFIPVNSIEEADVIITHRLIKSNALFLRPKNLIAGVGCNRGTSKEEFEKTIKEIFKEEGLSYHSIRSLATIDLKSDEEGLLEFADKSGLEIDFFPGDELNEAASACNVEKSEAVEAATGAVAVAEPAALLCAQRRSDNCAILVPKRKRGNVTLAIAKARFTL